MSLVGLLILVDLRGGCSIGCSACGGLSGGSGSASGGWSSAGHSWSWGKLSIIGAKMRDVGGGRGKCLLRYFTSWFIFVNPANIFHWAGVVVWLKIVSKKSSCWTWNWGGTRSVCRFSTLDTDLECLSELPRYKPTWHRVSHFGISYHFVALFSIGRHGNQMCERLLVVG